MRFDRRMILLFLPVVLAPFRPFPELLALLASLLGVHVVLRFERSQPFGRLSLLMAAFLLIQLYNPLLAKVPLGPWVFFGLILSIWVAVWINFELNPKKGNIEKPPAGLIDWLKSIPYPVLVGLAFPLFLTAFVLLGFQFSPIEVPEALRPWGGFRTLLAGSTLFFFFHWCLFSEGGLSQTSLKHLALMAKWSLSVLGVIFLGRLLLFILAFSFSLLSGSTNSSRSDSLLATTKSLAIQPLDWLVREHLLGAGLNADVSGDDWVRWAKDASRDPLKSLKAPSPLLKFLVKGGLSIPAETDPTSGHPAVGIAVSAGHQNLYVLFDQGLLVKISEGVSPRTFPPESGRMVHLRLDQNQNPLLLEASGRLTRIEPDGSRTLLARPVEGDPGFRRLAVQPGTGDIFALDLYGVFYRLDREGHWLADERFKPFSKENDIASDIARDITLSPDGTIYMLDCYGRVYSSPLASADVKGPVQDTHFWPKNPLGQSIQAFTGAGSHGYIVVDRYGGVYPDPDPRNQHAPQSSVEPYLFPWSLPRKDQDVVDHVFLDPQRWIYLLTRKGQVLTNYRWADIWAE